MNGGKVFGRNFGQILGVTFGYNEGMPFGDRIDIFKGKDFVIFIDLETGDISLDYFTKNAIFHGIATSC
jgi:hypothetical protein